MISVGEVKKALLLYSDTETEIENQLERLELLNGKIYSVGSPTLSDMPKSPSPSNDRMAELVSRKEEIENNISDLSQKQKERREKILSIVDRLDNSNKRAVIRMRYIDGCRWLDVTFMIFGRQSDYMEKQDSYVRRVMIIHGQALKDIADSVGDINQLK